MDIRSVAPSQLIAESGSDIVVINFGSANLRVGIATAQSPVVVPHCIAHHLLGSRSELLGVHGERLKGSAPEVGFATRSISPARRAERHEMCQMVELQLKMKPCTLDPLDREGIPEVREEWKSMLLDEDESFQWTEVVLENAEVELDSAAVRPLVDTNREDGNLQSGPTNASEHEPECSEDEMQQDPEQESSKDSEGEGPKELGEEIIEGSEREVFNYRDEDMAEDSEGDARNESQEETMRTQPEEVVVEDDEGDARKGGEEEFVEDDEGDAQKEREVEFVEDRKADSRKESVEEFTEDLEGSACKEPEEEFVEYSEEDARKGPGEFGEDSDGDIRLDPEEENPVETGTPTEHEPTAQKGSDLEMDVELRQELEESVKAVAVQQPTQKHKYRQYICGEEAQCIAVMYPYFLRRPICRGHLNITPDYSLQQVCDDLYLIWNWVLTEKLSLGSKTREEYSAVLVIPDTLDNREIKELLWIVLRDLRFRSAVVHQESVAATFGNGMSSACVVNMGAQVTSVVCVEDGITLPATRIVMPFGGEDISRCLLWVQQRWQTWPPIDTDPLHDPLDLITLERIKETYCLIIEGEQHSVLEIPHHEAGSASILYRGSLTALNVPVMGLFYPSLLAPEEYGAPLRPGFHLDHEDTLDDSVHVESSRKSDAAELILPSGNNGGLTVAYSEAAVDDSLRIGGSGVEENPGLAEAIVNSILSTGRADLQKKLFTSIQLVGGTAYTRGLIDAVEERVLHAIPTNEAVDTVGVLQNRTEAPIACWKGGAVLGILDFARDAWVHHDDWVTGGVRLGYGRKYKDSFSLHSQAFYFSAAIE